MIQQPLHRVRFASRLFCLAALGLLSAAALLASGGNPEKTKQLIEVLQSNAGLYEKARACQQAGEFGTAAVIPALAALLDDEHLAAYARSGLENIPDPAAAGALRSALGSLKGDRLIGVINSLGVLRDEKAIGVLQQLAADPGKGVVKESLLALGRISTPASIETVRTALRSAPAEFRPDAASACLMAAERQLATGKSEVAKSIYDDVRAVELPKPLRAAAVYGAIMSRQSSGLSLLLEQLRSEDPVLRGVALRAARELPGGAVTRALATELSQSKPAVQELLVGVLVDRHDPAALKTIESLVASDTAEVRQAALKALATIGSSSSVPLLLKSVVSGNETESAIALASLGQIKAEGTESQILKKLPGLAPSIRARLIGVLGERNSVGVVGDLLKLSADPDPEVGSVVFRVLAVVARPGDVTKLIPAALASPEGAVREQAERAVFMVSLKAAADRRAEPVLKALASAKTTSSKGSLIRILGSMGGVPACQSVLAALKDGDESVREVAFRALVDWPDAAPVANLIEVVKGSPTPVHRALALRGAIRMASREHASPQAVDWFKQLNQAVQSLDEKRMIISGLIQLGGDHAEGLQMLQPYLDDPAVQAEAGQALVQSAPVILHVKHADLLKALLERIAATTSDATLRNKAAELAKRILGKSAELKGAPLQFRPLFDGQSFAGWEGDTAKSFRIESGAIVGGSLKAPVPRNEFLATTRRYTNFVLRAECKLLGPANGGIQVRTERIPNRNEVIGYQADMSVGKEGGWWGNLYDESRRGLKLGQRENLAQMVQNLKVEDWNQYEIRCEGRHIQLFVNGLRTFDFTETDEKIPADGIIAVQIHGGPASEAWYRNLQIAELP